MVYDGQGRRESLTFYRRDKEKYIQEDYHFDERGRLVLVTHTDENETNDQAWWKYDDASQMVEEYTRGEGTRTYEWSPGSRLWKMVDKHGDDESTTVQNDMQKHWAPDGTLKQTGQSGVQEGNDYDNEIKYTHTLFEAPIETQVRNKNKKTGETGIGTTTLGANGEPMEYVDEHNQAKRNKKILSLPNRDVIEVAEDGTTSQDVKV